MSSREGRRRLSVWTAAREVREERDLSRTERPARGSIADPKRGGGCTTLSGGLEPALVARAAGRGGQCPVEVDEPAGRQRPEPPELPCSAL
jgi:hypothetical protein